MPDQNNNIVITNYNSITIFNIMTFIFITIYMFSPITLAIPDMVIFATPNEIIFAIAGFHSVVLLLLILSKRIKFDGLVSSLGLIMLYYGYLLLSSLWASHPEDTINAIKFDLFYIFIFILFYLYSLNNGIRSINTLFIYSIIPAAICVLAGYLINPSLTRLGFNGTGFLTLASTFISYRIITGKENEYKFYLLLSVATLSVIISMNKAWAVASVLGTTFLFILGRSKLRPNRIIITAIAVLSFSGALFLAVKDIQYFTLSTFSGLTGKDISYGDIYIQGNIEDKVRNDLFRLSNDILLDNWLVGIGYMNFMSSFEASFPGTFYYTITGKPTSGVTIHNVFQSWAVEGGIPLIFIVFLILRKYIRILKKQINLSANDEHSLFCKMLIVILVQLLIVGWFHQLHQTVQLWMMIGIVFGLTPGKRIRIS